ncbi:hypothetical protein CNMCM5623_007220 [Aspergillus felis]|uniref:Uncharacterized protein n=1 Tax=Aspergillus felis TaxID=1287682 RepID=A0A8H6PWP3_9EURO|nr:hypothetical protein CNMCM5623_007220 [Aspergillus felis]
MSKLELKLEGWGEKANQRSVLTPMHRYVGTTDYSQAKVFQSLNDHLQPDSNMSLDSVVHSILALLPEKEPLSTEVWSVGKVVLQLAEKESLRDWYNGPGEDAWQELPNLNAFFAHEASTHIRPHQPDFAIWALRDAFENPAEPLHWSASFKGMRDQQIIVAAQYILWDGQELFRHVLCPDSIENTKSWEPGLLYFGDSSLSLKRWRFWKDGFRKAAGEDSGMSDECRKVSTKAATLMEALEASMIF